MEFSVIGHLHNILFTTEGYFGCEFYKDKPMFLINYTWYDGVNYCIHLGPFYWIAY